MSQTKVFANQVNNIEAILNDLDIDKYNEIFSGVIDVSSEELQNHFVEFQKLNKVLNDVGQELEADVLPLSEKMLAKMNQIDPVTGNKRFGPSTQASIKSTVDKLNVVKVQHEKYIEDVTRLMNNIRENAPTLFDIINATDEKSMKVEEIPDSIITHESNNVSPKKVIQTTEEDTKVHEEAEKIRDQKAQEVKEFTQFVHDVTKSIETTVDTLNHIVHFGMLEDSSLNQALTLLESAEGKDSATYKDSLRLLIKILDRIIARPDDENARKLRLTHISLQKLVRLKGGLQLLAVLGFLSQVKDAEAYSTALKLSDTSANSKEKHVFLAMLGNSIHETEESRGFKSGVKVASMDHLRQTMALLPVSTTPVELDQLLSNNYSEVMNLLHPHTKYEIIMLMEEPKLDEMYLLSVGTKINKNQYSGTNKESNKNTQRKNYSWIEWFDALKVARDLMDKYLTEATTLPPVAVDPNDNVSSV